MTIQKLASDTRNTVPGHILLSKICDLQTLGMPLGKSEGEVGMKIICLCSQDVFRKSQEDSGHISTFNFYIQATKKAGGSKSPPLDV